MYLFGREDDVCCVRWVAVVAVLAVLALHATIPIPHHYPSTTHQANSGAYWARNGEMCSSHLLHSVSVSVAVGTRSIIFTAAVHQTPILQHSQHTTAQWEI